jgi:orotidine-5'-phosphate decarboxylase
MSSSEPKLIVALDHCSEREARALVDELQSAGVNWFKVGLELYTQTGPRFVSELKKHGLFVFLDLKLYDIPNTVGQAVHAAVDTGADLLTLHCSGGSRMLQAAQRACDGSQLSLLGVTVLTSFGSEDFPGVSSAWGAPADVLPTRGAVALRLATLAAQSGLRGVVCSAADLSDGSLKQVGWSTDTPLFVTPGIRNTSDAVNDQTSVVTVAQAVAFGSTHLVVGRPITAAGDRMSAAKQFIKQIRESHGLTSNS